MSKMTRDILAVSTTDVKYERVFSVVETIYDHHKNFNLEIFFAMMMIRFHN
jgi:hypothetical protein